MVQNHTPRLQTKYKGLEPQLLIMTQWEWTDFIIKFLTCQYGKEMMEEVFCEFAFGC